MPDQVRVFVSHHHLDNAWCREFVGALQAAGWDVWYDEKGLGAGAEWVATIQREVQACDILLLVLTPDAWRSQWVHEELNLALATRKRIIPVMHQPTEVGGFLLTRQWVDVVGMPGAEAARKVIQVQNSLGGPVSSTEPSPATPSPASPQKSAGSGILGWFRRSAPPAPLAPPQPSAQVSPSQGPGSRSGGSISHKHLTSTSLYGFGFRAYMAGSTEYILPPLCPVPGGVFIMGSDKARDNTANKNEMPQHSVLVGDFWIGMYPVTVAEYDCAVRVKAVREPLNQGETDWTEQIQSPDYPVIGVTWETAQDYARWLAQLTGKGWRLPTEAEWEKAARGTDGRIFPWGDTFDKAKCNIGGSYDDLTPVGTYRTVGGGSPYGVQDMIGNVWEWTSSQFKPYPYEPNDGRENPYSTSERVLRGGAWSETARFARAAYRKHDTSTYGFIPFGFSTCGFRLALSAAVS